MPTEPSSFWTTDADEQAQVDGPGVPGAAGAPADTNRMELAPMDTTDLATVDSTDQVPIRAKLSDIHPEDPDDEWLLPETGRTVRVRALTGALVILVVLAGGFWGGVVAEKHHGSGSTSSSAASSLFSRFAASRGAGTGTGTGTGTGASSFFGGGAATTGTVIGVQGNVLDVSDANGNLIKVTVGPSVTVTRTTSSSLSGLQVGDTVIISGSSGSGGGTVTATAVRATAKGVTAGGGTFAGGGGAGAGAGAGG